MSRTSQTLTNTDLAFLLCTLAATRQSPKASLSFETDYGLVLSLEPDGSITIGLRKPTEPEKQYSNPFDSTTPIQPQQRFAFPSVSVAEPSSGCGSIDGVLRSPLLPLGLGTGTGMGMGIEMGGANITPARSPPSMPKSTLTRTSSQHQSQRNMATNSNSNSISPKTKMKIRYYIRPGLEVNSSSHMYYTAAQDQPAQPQPAAGSSKQHKLRLHRVKLSHLQSLYHTPLTSSSRSKSTNSWFDSYLDWIDRLEDALSRQHEQVQTPQTPITALPLSPTPLDGAGGNREKGSDMEGPFTDSGEKSLWLVEGLLLASWLSLQEGVEGVEYLPLCSLSSASSTSASASEGDVDMGMGMGVYRLQQLVHEGLEGVEDEAIEIGERKGNGKPGNNAGVMMGRLLEVIRGAGDGAGE